MDELFEPKPKKGTPFLLILFVVGLVVPLVFYLGPVRLSVYRFVLLVAFPIVVFGWLSGKCGPKRVPDFLVIFIAIWSGFSLAYIYGLESSVESIGINTIETIGAYFLGRYCITNADRMYSFVRLMFLVLLVLAPFAIFETLTAKNLALQIFDMVGTVPGDTWKEPRWGMDRVQGPFEHPILYGVYSGSILGLTYYVLGYGKSFMGKVIRTGTVFIVAVLSFSSGPLAAMTCQTGLIGWDLIFRRFTGRWKLLGAGLAFNYVVVDILSNRSPIEVMLTYLTFNAHTAFNRVAIWHYGIKSVFNYPFFGIGFEEWVRAWFMSTSMDMFWLVHGVRHGLPAMIAYLLLVIGLMWSAGTNKAGDERQQSYAKGYVISMMGLFLAGWTVHYWNATYALIMFLFGAGVWMIKPKKQKNQNLDDLSTQFVGNIPAKPLHKVPGT